MHKKMTVSLGIALFLGACSSQGPSDPQDSDGIVDAYDGCPDEAGIPENSGCPDLDRDADGVVDRLDNCPDQGPPPDL